jgi:hypothetical protein
MKSLPNLGFTKSADEVGRTFLPLRSRDSLLKGAAVLEKPLPSGVGDGVFGDDFVKHDLEPWTAPGIELLLPFYMHQLAESISGLKRALFNFPSWGRSILQVKFAEFYADFICDLIAAKNG